MLFVDYTCPTPEENLALDEALLEEAETADKVCEFLRLWEPTKPLVVIGRSSKAADEVRLDECRGRGVPVLRRCSGGAAVVTGPGCLMYAVILSYHHYPQLRAIDLAHKFVLGRIIEALTSIVPQIEFKGTCDLTWRQRKFSGNALRCRREHLLYHGTLLYNFPLALIEQCLSMPPRVPEYRAGRAHETFVTNLPANRDQLRRAVQAAFPCQADYDEWNRAVVERLVNERFSRDDWNLRL